MPGVGPKRGAAASPAAICALLLAGCSAETFLNQTASRGWDTAGSTSIIRVIFINNTPYRAIFTYGTYNNTDPSDVPYIGQFMGRAEGPTLEANATAEVETVACDRVFSIGDTGLLRLIDENLDIEDTNLDEEALVQGVAFSRAELGQENAGVATEGFAAEVRALLGVDFPCGSILVIRFEVADLGEAPFRADFEVIPPREDDRGM